ncbi:hypothetical protein CCZ01_08625 [Helicobacter monodelphidis]|uniref:group III truncated hemoglobin n=1 Tax=Helicobacter sp. 15-1451 TaxID=2004995 RepID=UPI000DCCD534|nr:group III truncated hemoglobin [Helicobacter sp. 15-1451]RAX56761.1 hypothetical protein CCZ01_08625 [Helicobacter sp. 15-1451]
MSVYQEINVESIEKLMDVFYAKIRADKGELGAIFNGKIGTTNAEWAKHKAKIALFWRNMLLGEPVYDGQPLKAHLDLPPFKRELFTEWLNLFSQSLEEVFSDGIKIQILQRAEMIAQRFQFMLYESGH